MLNEAFLQGKVPAEWLDQDLWDKEFGVALTVQQALSIMGLCQLALKHPELPQVARMVGTAFVQGLQSALEQLGLPPPKQGWNADAPYPCPICSSDTKENAILDVIYCDCGWSELMSEHKKKRWQS